MDLKFLNYYSIFSMYVYSKGSWHTKYDRTAQICFRLIFERIEGVRKCPKTLYKIVLFKEPDKLKDSFNNYCLFDKKTIVSHLKQAQKVVPEFSKFIIEDTHINGIQCYEISLHIDETSPEMHKYLLTWVRFLYEASFSIMLLDVFRLSKLPECKFVSIINLMNVVESCYANGKHFPYFNTWHSIGMGHQEEFLTFKEIRKGLLERKAMNQLFPERHILIPVLDNSNEKASTLEFWVSDDDFNTYRKNIYLKAFNILKQGYPYCH